MVAEAAAAEAVPVRKDQVCPTIVEVLDRKVDTLADQVMMVMRILVVVILVQVAIVQVVLGLVAERDNMDLLEPLETLVLLMLEIWDMLIPEVQGILVLLEPQDLLEIQGILEPMGMLEI